MRKPKEGWSPPPSSLVSHSVEDGVPLCRFDISTKIFIEALSRATILPLDFEGLPDLQAICEALFVFSAHGFKDRWVFPFDRFAAYLFVLGDP